MFKFVANIFAAQRNARLLAEVRADLFLLETKAKSIISHATGGVTSDLDATLNDICVEISAAKNRVFIEALAMGAERKAKELAGDLLHSMHDVERRVLVVLHDEVCRPLALIASEVGRTIDEVRTIIKGFVIKGLAHFGPAVNDDGRPAGSGYTLTGAGAALKSRQLAADVAASAAAAKAVAG